jgi:hypothetical protein
MTVNFKIIKILNRIFFKEGLFDYSGKFIDLRYSLFAPHEDLRNVHKYSTGLVSQCLANIKSFYPRLDDMRAELYREMNPLESWIENFPMEQPSEVSSMRSFRTELVDHLFEVLKEACDLELQDSMIKKSYLSFFKLTNRIHHVSTPKTDLVSLDFVNRNLKAVGASFQINEIKLVDLTGGLDNAFISLKLPTYPGFLLNPHTFLLQFLAFRELYKLLPNSMIWTLVPQVGPESTRYIFNKGSAGSKPLQVTAEKSNDTVVSSPVMVTLAQSVTEG